MKTPARGFFLLHGQSGVSKDALRKGSLERKNGNYGMIRKINRGRNSDGRLQNPFYRKGSFIVNSGNMGIQLGSIQYWLLVLVQSEGLMNGLKRIPRMQLLISEQNAYKMHIY